MTAARTVTPFQSPCANFPARPASLQVCRPPVFPLSFPLHLDYIVPIRKDITISGCPILPYRGIRYYRIGVSDITVSGYPTLPYRGIRHYHIGVSDITISGRTGEPDAGRLGLAGRPLHVCHAANVRAVCGGGQNKLFHVTFLWYRGGRSAANLLFSVRRNGGYPKTSVFGHFL